MWPRSASFVRRSLVVTTGPIPRSSSCPSSSLTSSRPTVSRSITSNPSKSPSRGIPASRMAPVESRPTDELDEPELTEALLELVTPWLTESNGVAKAVVVEGDAVAAASCLSADEFRIGTLTTKEALQRMAWAASSGGAHGRRRGAALGRFTSLYTGALITDLSWPPDFDELEDGLEELNFYRWEEDSPPVEAGRRRPERSTGRRVEGRFVNGWLVAAAGHRGSRTGLGRRDLGSRSAHRTRR